MRTSVKKDALGILTPEDCLALQGIYAHRCLNEEQLTDFFYRELDTGENDYTLGRIRALISAGFIEVCEYGPDQNCVFYLTHMGVQYIRDISEEPLYRVSKNGKHRLYEATYSQLKMHDNLLDHQLHLNSLSLDIERRCGLDPKCYKDSMFASNFTYAQPDGVFELPDMDIFLEMDMCHERVSALKAKWEHYRTYLNSKDYYLRRNKRIVVLFATENAKALSLRRASVVKSLVQSIFELFGPKFDCYIGPNAKMAEIAERLIKKQPGQFERVCKYLRDEQGFSFGRSKKILDACREPYLYMFARDREGRLVVEAGRPREFLFEDYSDRQILGIKRAAFYPSTQSLLSSTVKRNIPLLILVPNEEDVFRDLKAAGSLFVPNVYYITEARLKDRPLHKAIFQFDQLGNRYCFTDQSLTERKYEKKQT